MYAEALNELNRSAEAVPYIGQVRYRAGLTRSLPATDKASIQKVLAKERQVEFCFENQRWFDLLRTGKAMEVMTAHGEREKKQKVFIPSTAFHLTDAKLLLPIPNLQVVISGLSQNPGY